MATYMHSLIRLQIASKPNHVSVTDQDPKIVHKNMKQMAKIGSEYDTVVASYGQRYKTWVIYGY